MDRDQWNKRYAAQDFVWTVEANRFVVAELSALAPGRALDLASGEGRNAVWLARRGWRVDGVDFSEAGVEKARRLAVSQGVEVDLFVADLLEYAPKAASYDLVLICYLQLPRVQRQKVVAAACEALAPGGTLLWVAHDLSNLEGGYGGPSSAAVLSTPDDIVADLRGLQVVKAQVVERAVQLEDGEALALDTLVRAERPH